MDKIKWITSGSHGISIGFDFAQDAEDFIRGQAPMNLEWQSQWDIHRKLVHNRWQWIASTDQPVSLTISKGE